MAKSTRQINKENDMSDNSPDSPAVLAYRLGQLESAVIDGFKEHNSKLDELVAGFVTKEYYLEQHNNLKARVAVLEQSRSRTWIFNTLSAVAGAVLLFLVQYALTH